MKKTEWLTVIISFLALIVSLFTLYEEYLTPAKLEITFPPTVSLLYRMNNTLSLTCSPLFGVTGNEKKRITITSVSLKLKEKNGPEIPMKISDIKPQLPISVSGGEPVTVTCSFVTGSTENSAKEIIQWLNAIPNQDYHLHEKIMNLIINLNTIPEYKPFLPFPPLKTVKNYLNDLVDVVNNMSDEQKKILLFHPTAYELSFVITVKNIKRPIIIKLGFSLLGANPENLDYGVYSSIFEKVVNATLTRN